MSSERSATDRPADRPSSFDRRSLLAAAAAAGVGAALGPAGRAAAEIPEQAGTATTQVVPRGQLVPYRSGTTLRAVATPRGRAGYRRLDGGPGWKRVVRQSLADAKPGRVDRRYTLTAFVQLTDLHITDVQHPLRFEYRRSGAAVAWRPHEALTVPGAVALIERVNTLSAGPATGSPLSFVMTTGDNTDNNSTLELEWFLAVMTGGVVTPNSGDPQRYEGVQNSGLKLYWHPDDNLRDADKRLGFPRVEGYLAAAIRPVTSPGLRLPWYSTVGNHDDLHGGVYRDTKHFFADVAVGDRKLQSVPAAIGREIYRTERRGADPLGKLVRRVLRERAGTARRVTPDERRAPFGPRQYLAAHLDPAYAGEGGGPVGHGYTQTNLDAGTLYYSFRISDDVLGVSLDTTSHGGQYTGAIGTGQLRWLERTLTAHKHEHVIVFSHHNSASMVNHVKDPARPGEARHTGAELVARLRKHRNVRAWINGHSHRNEIIPHGSFWEVTTASHVDFPQLARVIELVDNRDGTLSLFTTLVEAQSPYRTDYTDLSQTGLASLYRELSFNATSMFAPRSLAGAAGDRNTELLLKRG